MKRLLFCGLVFLLPLSSVADSGSPAFQGIGLCRFTLHQYTLSRANEERINYVVSDLLKRHREAFNFTTSADFHLRIRIFGQFEDYCRFASTNHSGFENQGGPASVTNIAGYYSGRNNEVVTWRQNDPSYLANNILHECSHAIMRSQFDVLPIWLNEGCAVYFSFPLSMRDKSDLQRLQSFWHRINKYADERSLPGLRAFLNLSDRDFYALPAERSYPVSWSLFQLLMSTPENRKAMNWMLRQIQKQDPRAPDCARLLDESYPGGLAKMEKDWREWISRGAASVLKSKQPATR